MSEVAVLAQETTPTEEIPLASPSFTSQRDRGTRLEIYDEFGSLEFWIADWRAKLRLVESRLQNERVISPILTRFSGPASRFFN